ncbi:MAG: hypothetical protein ACXWYS_00710 [Gaiellaceae bacterium]
MALALLGSLAIAAAACGGESSRATLPVTPCRTTNGESGAAAMPEDLAGEEPAPENLDEKQVSQLAWYEGDVNAQKGLRVLAPRGWRCSAVLGPSDSWGLTVQPAGGGGEQVKISAVYGGPAAQFACDYFRSAAVRAPVPASCAPPADTAITHVGDHLVLVETTVRGLPVQAMLFWYPDKAEGARCLLPRSREALCKAIIAEARARVGERLGTDATS